MLEELHCGLEGELQLVVLKHMHSGSLLQIFTTLLPSLCVPVSYSLDYMLELLLQFLIMHTFIYTPIAFHSSTRAEKQM